MCELSSGWMLVALDRELGDETVNRIWKTLRLRSLPDVVASLVQSAVE